MSPQSTAMGTRPFHQHMCRENISSRLRTLNLGIKLDDLPKLAGSQLPGGGGRSRRASAVGPRSPCGRNHCAGHALPDLCSCSNRQSEQVELHLQRVRSGVEQNSRPGHLAAFTGRSCELRQPLENVVRSLPKALALSDEPHPQREGKRGPCGHLAARHK